MWTDVVEVRLPGGFSYKGTVRAQFLSLFLMGSTFLGIYAGVKFINRTFNNPDVKKRKKQNLPPEVEESVSKKVSENAIPCQETTQPQEKPDVMEAETPRQETIIHSEATALVAGITNAGKSILALQIAVTAAGGRDYLALPGKPPMIAGEQKVLYISTEANIPQGRIKAVKDALGDSVANFKFQSYRPSTSNQEPGIGDFVPLYNLLREWVQQQKGDCLIVIDNLTVFKSISVEFYVKDFCTKLDEFKATCRQGGGCLTFLLVMHTGKPGPDIEGINGSKYWQKHAWPILMHCLRDPKSKASTRYLALRNFKDDRGATDETYDFDYRTEPFPHYELAAEDVSTDVNEDVNTDVNVNESVNTNVNDGNALQPTESAKPCKSNKRTPKEVIEKIRYLYQFSKKSITEIAELCNVSRPTVYKYTEDLPPRNGKELDM